jgi:hypothetical protein
MSGLRLDFGLLIAYLVPGFLLLYGLHPFVPELKLLLATGDSEKAVITAFAIAALSIVAGMAVSIVRFSTIDRTFEMDIRWSNFERYPHHRAIRRVEIDYGKLSDDGVLKAYLEAKSSELRPQQFYGNVLVVALVVSAARLAWPLFVASGEQMNYLLWVAIALAAVVILYPATRRSFARYCAAVYRLNGDA